MKNIIAYKPIMKNRNYGPIPVYSLGLYFNVYPLYYRFKAEKEVLFFRNMDKRWVENNFIVGKFVLYTYNEQDDENIYSSSGKLIEISEDGINWKSVLFDSVVLTLEETTQVWPSFYSKNNQCYVAYAYIALENEKNMIRPGINSGVPFYIKEHLEGFNGKYIVIIPVPLLANYLNCFNYDRKIGEFVNSIFRYSTIIPAKITTVFEIWNNAIFNDFPELLLKIAPGSAEKFIKDNYKKFDIPLKIFKDAALYATFKKTNSCDNYFEYEKKFFSVASKEEKKIFEEIFERLVKRYKL